MAEDSYPLKQSTPLCDQFRTTNWLVGVMVQVLRQYFASTDRITLEKASLLWTDDTTSKVQIDNVDNLKFQEGTKFPKILVDIENQEFPRDVIGDTMGYQPDGTIQFYNRNQSGFTIECWGEKKLESAAMADEVRYFLQAYRFPIADTYGFNTLRVKTVLKPVKYQVYKDYWICRLIVAFEIDEKWGTRKESLEVSNFNLALTAIANGSEKVLVQ